MGAKDSKPSFISYEDAVKRVSDSELRRIREAFKRCAGANGTALSLEAFVHEVLCDGVPYEVAEWLYQACGGTKRGIAFRELLCGIVVLTKGNIEEKIKFLWTLYVNNQGDNGTFIYKRDFARTLHLEHTSLPATASNRANEVLLSLFGAGEKVTFDQFRSWLLIHKDATVLSKWLLSEVNIAQDLETPTFYQSLAGVTHLEERDIIELEKCFWSLRNAAPTGQLDAESLSPLLSPPLPAAAIAGAFLAFDENRDGHVDFKELCCGLSAACRGPRTERLKFCFKIFDLDSDGVLNKKELIDMVGILCTVANENLKNQNSRASTPSDGNDSESTDKGFDPEVILMNIREKLVTVPRNGRKPIFHLGPNGDSNDKDKEVAVTKEPDADSEAIIANDMALTLEDFLIWSVETAEKLVTPFLDLVFEVCHIVLGLRPQCKHQERDIVLGWLRREVQRGYSVGQFWYLIASEWWSSWLGYTAGGSTDSCCRAPQRNIDEAIVCDESFTTNSTESMGSLLWRADSASLGSAGSSSGVSSAPAPRPARAPRAPGPIDNRRLLAPDHLKVRTLTGEGGHLRRDVTLAQHRDFELVPDALWRALAVWYGAPAPLPRQVIRPPNSDVELELYPLQLKILRHVPSTQRAASLGGVLGSVPLAPAPPERQLAYSAAFSRLATVKQVCEFLCGALGLAREDVRLWAVASAAVLLDDERPTLYELRLDERPRLLLELRNPDLTWPEEIGALGICSGSRATERRETLIAPNLPGATGLHNLGNTCFMNAALQSVWNTGPLTRYFNSGMHMYEVNTTNPLGTKGVLALRYGELCKEVWSCSARSVAPLRVRWCVSRWARALAGGGQHDAQELLAWLLDALHEDLNRVRQAPKAPIHHHDSDGRPDQVVAAEAWEQHTARNSSIMTDLFYGQLKSKVQCDTCARESVRFDAFNMLSLPLPMESYVSFEIRVMLLDGSVPIKYGVRVNSEGTYLDLKKKLSELCGLPPEALLIVELSGASIGRVFEDGAKISGVSALELFAYELPHSDCESDDSDCDDTAADTNGWCSEAVQWAERSRSEILMSQSPPNTFYNQAKYTDHSYRSSTLPKDLKKEVNGNSSPTLSVKSLNMKPSSPRLPKVKFGSSPSNMCKMDSPPTVVPATGKLQYLVAVHRKQCRSDAYFLPWQRSRSSLFGVPLLVGVRGGRGAGGAALSGRELYARVWAQVARLLSARPKHHDQHNHATDCDDSLGYEFPFRVRVVRAGGAWCARCAWPRLCRGCTLPSDDTPVCFDPPGKRRRARKRSSVAPAALESDVPDSSSPIAKAKLNRLAAARLSTDFVESESECCTVDGMELGALLSAARRGSVVLAIDWDPTALHLRYQSTREKELVEHWSVRASRAEAARAVDLASCLRAFTSSERLEQPYHCDGCRSAQPATKKLQIWRLPPIMIVHLKRFQYVNNKWIKSQKVVNFPFQDFDPTEYLASVPQETILRHMDISSFKPRSSVFVDDTISESDTDNDDDDVHFSSAPKEKVIPKEKVGSKRKSSGEVRGRQRLESTSLVTTPVTDDNLIDYHQHHLLNDQDPFQLKYRLYAVVSHSGQLSGGHYVAYCRNPSGAWLCYNDSSCRELAPAPAPPIDPAAAYLLFYERQGLRYTHSRSLTLPTTLYNDSSCRELAPAPAPPIDPAAAYLLFYERQGLRYTHSRSLTLPTTLYNDSSCRELAPAPAPPIDPAAAYLLFYERQGLRYTHSRSLTLPTTLYNDSSCRELAPAPAPPIDPAAAYLLFYERQGLRYTHSRSLTLPTTLYNDSSCRELAPAPAPPIDPAAAYLLFYERQGLRYTHSRSLTLPTTLYNDSSCRELAPAPAPPIDPAAAYLLFYERQGLRYTHSRSLTLPTTLYNDSSCRELAPAPAPPIDPAAAYLLFYERQGLRYTHSRSLTLPTTLYNDSSCRELAPAPAPPIDPAAAYLLFYERQGLRYTHSRSLTLPTTLYNDSSCRELAPAPAPPIDPAAAYLLFYERQGLRYTHSRSLTLPTTLYNDSSCRELAPAPAPPIDPAAAYLLFYERQGLRYTHSRSLTLPTTLYNDSSCRELAPAPAPPIDPAAAYLLFYERQGLRYTHSRSLTLPTTLYNDSSCRELAPAPAPPIDPAAAYLLFYERQGLRYTHSRSLTLPTTLYNDSSCRELAPAPAPPIDPAAAYLLFYERQGLRYTHSRSLTLPDYTLQRQLVPGARARARAAHRPRRRLPALLRAPGAQGLRYPHSRSLTLPTTLYNDRSCRELAPAPAPPIDPAAAYLLFYERQGLRYTHSRSLTLPTTLYNDSSCRELAPAPAPPIDPAAAYLLFYERQGLRYDAYLPDIEGKEPTVKDPDILDPDDTDLKKMCSII
ncbi:unnamed protein product [Arctia plantaginis]|uniref:ubiquitinyl hydrolase 1 n=1 Tax=Arctia plantaginis TaxID=874455 RepID=A0A8S0YLG5_ARCPL|nr:unnamed protein product [Arctia plantaginis]